MEMNLIDKYYPETVIASLTLAMTGVDASIDRVELEGII